MVEVLRGYWARLRGEDDTELYVVPYGRGYISFAVWGCGLAPKVALHSLGDTGLPELFCPTCVREDDIGYAVLNNLATVAMHGGELEREQVEVRHVESASWDYVVHIYHFRGSKTEQAWVLVLGREGPVAVERLGRLGEDAVKVATELFEGEPYLGQVLDALKRLAGTRHDARKVARRVRA